GDGHYHLPSPNSIVAVLRSTAPRRVVNRNAVPHHHRSGQSLNAPDCQPKPKSLKSSRSKCKGIPGA
ncbi:MAG: hypothetical protein M3N98_03945, partial [Actinomycetota bacterium]|nr:hypothetical protein [Actinomycetota bacterium]